MTTYNEIKSKVEFYPVFRERRHKNRCIAEMIILKYHLKVLPEKLEEYILEAQNYDRYWRQVMQRNPNLRGSDYEDRKKLVKEKQKELGYNAQYKN